MQPIESEEQLNESVNYIDYTTKTIYIYDEIDNELACNVSIALQKFKRSYIMEGEIRKPVTIKINSNGGSMCDTLAIVSDILNFYDNWLSKDEPHIITDITGIAYSGAAMIAIAGHSVRMSQLGMMMLHYPLWADGTKSLVEHEIDTKITREHFERAMSLLFKATNLTIQKFKVLANNKEVYLSPKEALKYNLIDNIY